MKEYCKQYPSAERKTRDLSITIEYLDTVQIRTSHDDAKVEGH
jgi:hypothetical protein